jgi:hypothetical protein
MQGEKCSQLGLSDTNDTANPVYDQITTLDPAPYRAGRNIERFGYGVDCVKLWNPPTALTAIIGLVGAHDPTTPETNCSSEL